MNKFHKFPLARSGQIFPLQIAAFNLRSEERWICTQINSLKSYHLILLGGDNPCACWEQQLLWAKHLGGDLPNRLELAILFQLAHEEFEPTAYWSNETHIVDPNCAWYKHFDIGTQYGAGKHMTFRARAIRRQAVNTAPPEGQ